MSMDRKGKGIKEDETVKRLPDDLIKDVFIRLPARSLGQFRCLSKSWLSYLTDPGFIHNHSIQVLARARARPGVADNGEQKLLCMLLKTNSLYKVNLETYLNDRIAIFDDDDDEGEGDGEKEEEEEDNDDDYEEEEEEEEEEDEDEDEDDEEEEEEEEDDEEEEEEEKDKDDDDDDEEEKEKDDDDDEEKDEDDEDDDNDDEDDDDDDDNDKVNLQTNLNDGIMMFDDNKDGILIQLDQHYTCSIIGSSNGLICIKQLNIHINEFFIIINPLTKEYRKVTYFDKKLITQYDGFGYDPSTHDYKIVRIRPLHQNDYAVDIFSLKNNCWRTIRKDEGAQIRIPYPDPFTSINEVAEVGGVLHWGICGFIRSNPQNSLFTFDLATNKCCMLDGIPSEEDDCEHEDEFPNIIIGVSVFEGCLCVARKRGNGVGYVMWVMKEYGVAESWSKLMEIEEHIPRFYPKPICYANNGRLILLQDYRMNALYNIEDGSIRIFVKMVKEMAFAFMETLVSPLLQL